MPDRRVREVDLEDTDGSRGIAGAQLVVDLDHRRAQRADVVGILVQAGEYRDGLTFARVDGFVVVVTGTETRSVIREDDSSLEVANCLLYTSPSPRD